VIYYCKYSDSSYSLLTSAEGFFSGLMQQHWIGLYKHDLFTDQIKLKDCFGYPREKCSFSHIGYCNSESCILILCTVPYLGNFFLYDLSQVLQAYLEWGMWSHLLSAVVMKIVYAAKHVFKL
jgi:hypothetical protein